MIPVVYLIDTISCDTSGTEKQLLEVINRLDKSRFAPYLICLYESDWMRANPLPCPGTVLGYNGLLKLNLPNVVQGLRKIVTEQNIQLIQTFFVDSIFVAWLATRMLSGNRVLLSSRRDMGLGESNQPWYHKLYSMVLPYVNKGFAGIIANSQQVRKYVAQRERISPEKIEVIYNAVEIPQAVGRRPVVFSEYPNAIWIVIVASLTPVKRHDVLVNALKHLSGCMDVQNIKVMVLGKGPQRQSLQRLIEHAKLTDLFKFEGAVANVPAYLHHCDIGVLCSDREGLSNAILEYMSCSPPVVATAVGGNTELVDRTNGICVPPDNPQALASALRKLVVDKEKRIVLGRASRQKVEKHFSWQRSMQHLESYYDRLIEDKGVARDQ